MLGSTSKKLLPMWTVQVLTFGLPSWIGGPIGLIVSIDRGVQVRGGRGPTSVTLSA